MKHEPLGFALEAKDSASESPFSPVDRCAKLTGGFVVEGQADRFLNERFAAENALYLLG